MLNYFRPAADNRKYCIYASARSTAELLKSLLSLKIPVFCFYAPEEKHVFIFKMVYKFSFGIQLLQLN